MEISSWRDNERKHRRVSRLTMLCLGMFVSMILLFFRDVQAVAETNESAKNGEIFDVGGSPRGRHELFGFWSCEYELTLERSVERNYSLDTNSADDLDFFSTEFEGIFIYTPSNVWNAYIDLELVNEKEFKDSGHRHDHDTEFNIKELNVSLKTSSPNVVVKAGRQPYKDKREWLYDEELDALRLFYQSGSVGLDASISGDAIFEKDLANNDERKDIYNLFLLAKYNRSQDKRYTAYLFFRNNHEDEERLRWAGVRAMGESNRGFSYWFDAAYLTGKSRIASSGRYQRIAAYGVDFGGTLVFKSNLNPSLSVGWAYGSGDHDSESGSDNNFRQTGLQDNNGRLNGFTRFKYYGEIFEPELSNLSIFTAGLGVHPFKKTSVDLLYHSYRQPAKADHLRDSNLERDPLGEDRDIGNEVDLILGFGAIKNFSMELVYGKFLPGGGFGEDAEKATHINFKLDYKF